jgi:hypothetical protein
MFVPINEGDERKLKTMEEIKLGLDTVVMAWW